VLEILINRPAISLALDYLSEGSTQNSGYNGAQQNHAPVWFGVLPGIVCLNRGENFQAPVRVGGKPPACQTH